MGNVGEEKSDNGEVQVQGSGRTIFYLLKIVGDLIDDELQVSDALKCVGKKVDNGARVVRVATSAVSKVSMKGAQAKLGNWYEIGTPCDEIAFC